MSTDRQNAKDWYRKRTLSAMLDEAAGR